MARGPNAGESLDLPVVDGEDMKVDGDARALERVAALYGLNGVAVREREGEEGDSSGREHVRSGGGQLRALWPFGVGSRT